MKPVSHKRQRFPADVIRYAMWLHFRFSLGSGDVEELPAQRGIEVNYDPIRCWSIKFEPLITRRLDVERQRPLPTPRWHPDQMVCWIGGRRMYLWRAVDDEGEVLDLVVQRRRHGGGAEVSPTPVAQPAGGAADDHDDRLLFRRGSARPAATRSPSSTGPAAGEQSGGELAPADPAARTPAAAVQIPSPSPEIPRHPRGDLQHLQHPASSDQRTHAPAFLRRS